MTDKKEFHMACYKEAIWKLSILFFGDDPYIRNNLLGLKRLMSKLTPDPKMGMDKYKRWMAELNSYLPYTLCKAAYKKSQKEKPSMLCEDELLEKHEMALITKEGSGCKALLENKRNEHLSRMFRLFSKMRFLWLSL